MADFHVMQTSPDKDTATVAIHAAVPGGNNSVGVAWATALLEYLGGSQSTRVPWLAASNPTEATQITNGEVYESVETTHFDANATNAEKLSAMQSFVSTRQSQITSYLAEVLRFWGYDGSVT